jgi:hypothetical protein
MDLLVMAVDSGKPIIPPETVAILVGRADRKEIDWPSARVSEFPELEKPGFELEPLGGVHKRPWVETASLVVAVGTGAIRPLATSDLRSESSGADNGGRGKETGLAPTTDGGGGPGGTGGCPWLDCCC